MLERGGNWMSTSTNPPNLQLFNAMGVGGRTMFTLDGREIQHQWARHHLGKVIQDVVGLRGSDITTVRMSPQLGVLLFLDGVLTLEHLKQAKETRDTVTCSGVLIEGASFTLVVERGLQPWKPILVDNRGREFS